MPWSFFLLKIPHTTPSHYRPNVLTQKYLTTNSQHALLIEMAGYLAIVPSRLP
jgi:hypothetical protein